MKRYDCEWDKGMAESKGGYYVRAEVALALYDALNGTQWVRHRESTYRYCPACFEREFNAHKSSCHIGNALKLAEGE